MIKKDRKVEIHKYLQGERQTTKHIKYTYIHKETHREIKKYIHKETLNQNKTNERTNKRIEEDRMI